MFYSNRVESDVYKATLSRVYNMERKKSGYDFFLPINAQTRTPYGIRAWLDCERRFRVAIFHSQIGELADRGGRASGNACIGVAAGAGA